MYCILDKKAKIYHQPQFIINDQVATRIFHSLVNGQDGMMKDYPEDYDLYRVGAFCMESGLVKPEAYPAPVASGLNMRGPRDEKK